MKTKKMQYGMLTAAAMACSVITSQASLTYVNLSGDNGEPILYGPAPVTGPESGQKSIMNTVYGAGNYTRVDDSSDQIWSLTSPTGTASLTAIYAGNSQALYTTDLAGINKAGPVLTVSGQDYEYNGGAAQTGTISSTYNPFLFADESPATSGVFWSSDPSLNSADNDNDHMVTFLITGGADKGDYVIAFEDTAISGGSDQDYNDFVVQVSGVVPVPETTTVVAGMLLLLPLGASTVRILRQNRVA